MEPDEVNAFFNDLSNQKRQKTLQEKIIEHAEEEFTGFSKEHQARQKEKGEIREEIIRLRKKLKTLKNTRNVKQRSINQKKAQKRNEIKKEISRLHVRLQEIADEEPSQ